MPYSPKHQKAYRDKEKRTAEQIDRELNPETYEHTTKECKRCHQEKPLKDFPVAETRCSLCKTDIQRIRRLEDPPKVTWMSAKARAAMKGIPFEITIEDVRAAWTDTCPVLLIPLKFNVGGAGPDSPSIDRIDNSKGYVPGNIAIVSNLFNSMKRDLTPTILRRMLAYMEGRLLP